MLTSEGCRLARGIAVVVSSCPRDGWHRGAVAAWLRRTGSGRPPRGDLTEPCRLHAAGEWEQAARLWTGRGCPYEGATAERRLLRRRLMPVVPAAAAAEARCPAGFQIEPKHFLNELAHEFG
jgi:hypothetical protein